MTLCTLGALIAAGGLHAASAQTADAPAGARAQVAPAGANGDARARLQVEVPAARIDARRASGLGLSLPGDDLAARALAFVAGHPGLFALPAGGALVAGAVQGRAVRLEQRQGDDAVRQAGVTLVFDAAGRLDAYTDETKAFAARGEVKLDALAAVRAARETLGVPDTGRAPVVRRALSVLGDYATPVYEVDLMVRPPLGLARVLVDATTGRVIGREALVRP